MIKSSLLSIITFLAFTTVQAEDPLKFPRLLNYEDVTVHKVLVDGIVVFHKSGSATIPYEDLPQTLQTELAFDPEAAALHRAQEKEASEIRLSQAREQAKLDAEARVLRDSIPAVLLKGKVLRVMETGVLLQNVKLWDGTTKEEIKQKIVSQKPSNPLAANQTAQNVLVEEVIYTPDVIKRKLAFVALPNPGFTIDAEFEGTVYTFGSHTAISATGSRLKVPAFTPDVALAAKSLRDGSAP